MDIYGTGQEIGSLIWFQGLRLGTEIERLQMTADNRYKKKAMR